MHSWFARLTRYNRPVLWMATLVHFFWGVGLVLIPDKVARTTGLWPYSQAPEVFGLLMLASATAAFTAIIHDARGLPANSLTFWAFIPQQAFLMVSAGACLYFASQGHFADGTVVPGGGWFILYDQIIKVMLALLHPFGVLRLNVAIFPAHSSLTRIAGDETGG